MVGSAIREGCAGKLEREVRLGGDDYGERKIIDRGVDPAVKSGISLISFTYYATIRLE